MTTEKTASRLNPQMKVLQDAWNNLPADYLEKLSASKAKDAHGKNRFDLGFYDCLDFV